MSSVRIAATVLFGLRVAYGAALLAAPHRITRRWLGPARETAAAKVALRALGTDRRMWDPVLDRLAAERDVIAVDMPGFGGSAPIDPATPSDLARAVAAHLAALGVERPHVAGNSLGGWVALELALTGEA